MMSTIIYERTLYNDIHTKEVLVNQLEKALSDLKADESNLFCFDFAGLSIELDRRAAVICVIA